MGELVPVGDALAFANAMKNVLDNRPDPERLKSRAAMFSIQQSVDSYLKLVNNCMKKKRYIKDQFGHHHKPKRIESAFCSTDSAKPG